MTRGQHETNFDLYVDGLLAEPERTSFERAMAEDAVLRQQMAQQRALDDCIRELYSVGDCPQLFAGEPGQSANGRAVLPTTAKARDIWFRRGLGIAASILIAAVAVWQIAGWLGRGPVADPYATGPWRSLETVYRDKLADGFRVDWQCKDDEEFQRTFAKRLGQPLALGKLPQTVQSLGLGYCSSISTRTVFLLARVDDREVVVFADRLRNDAKTQAVTDPDLHLFRGEIGKLVLYELTPLPEPRVLPFFTDPSVPNP